jgi:hypothetical protein
MAETVELIAQLNATWRIVRVSGRERSPCWYIQNVVDDRAGAFFRAKHMVIEYITFIVAKDGTIDPAAVQILAALPDRCDRDPDRRPAPKPNPRPEERPVHRDCRRCGSVFVMSYNGGRVFCSGPCKDAYHGEKRTARKAARRAARASTAATVTEQPPAALDAPSPRKRPRAPAAERPLTREQELAEQMKRDRIEVMAAAARRDLPERISAAARKQTGKGWALQR